MIKKIMKIEKLQIKDLKPAEYNPRQATKDQEKHLKASLEKFGVVEPVIVNKHKDRNNIIVGGHFRIREIKKLGYKEIDCVIVDLPLEDEKELNIRLNSNNGEWDMDLLANNFDIGELEDWGLNLDFDIDDNIKIKDLSNNLKEKFLVEIECLNEEEQEKIYEETQKKYPNNIIKILSL